jgi:ABC-type uncharacterized transport system permease subunit
MLHDLCFASLRIATPLIYAALGGLLTYQAGILNIALDGFMTVGAFAAIWAAWVTGNLLVAVAAGMVCGAVLAALLALFNLRFKADIFIAGIAVNFLAYGLTSLLLSGVFGQDGVFQSSTIPTSASLRLPGIAEIPWIGSVHTPMVYLAYLLVPVVAWVLARTPWGLRVRLTGESEDAAAQAGVPVARLKLQTMLCSGVLCGVGGAYLSLDYVTLFPRGMTNDRGLIALAAIFFARGRPFGTAAVAVLFGAATALAVRLPEVTGIAPQLLQLLPYLITLLALVAVGIRT